jgi:exosortase/archaeosortase
MPSDSDPVIIAKSCLSASSTSVIGGLVGETDGGRRRREIISLQANLAPLALGCLVG